MNVSADLDIFFSDFATLALCGGKSLKALFVEPNKTLSNFDLGISSTDPQAIMKSADVVEEGIDSGTLLSFNGVVYRVLGSPNHDGAGLATVALTVDQQ